MEWIKVEDRLPEFNSDVIVSWNEMDGGVSVGKLIKREIVEDVDGVDQFLDWEAYDSTGTLDLQITHWMPLPERPND